MTIKQNMDTLSSIELVLSFRSDCLNDCTALSASPLDDGWYGGDGRCLIPFRLKNDSNSALVKFRALSVTIREGRPNSANAPRRAVMIADVVEFIIRTSIHLE